MCVRRNEYKHDWLYELERGEGRQKSEEGKFMVKTCCLFFKTISFKEQQQLAARKSFRVDGNQTSVDLGYLSTQPLCLHVVKNINHTKTFIFM